MICCFIGGEVYLDKVERQCICFAFVLHAEINENSAPYALVVLAELCTHLRE